MNIRKVLPAAAFLYVALLSLANAAMDDDPVIYALEIKEIEWRDDADNQAWDVEAWAGKDINKFLFKTEGETADNQTEEFETQVLWNRAVARYWDVQMGWRRDWQPEVRRDWFALGLSGLAPGFVHAELTGYVSEEGTASIRVKADYTIVLSQRLTLEPKAELNWFSDADAANVLGRGLASTELGLRLKFAVRRNLKPYVGLHWEHLSGSTAGFAREEGESDSELSAVLGLQWSL